MSRTRLTILVALGLVAVSAGIFFTRRATGGVDIGGPAGVSSWEVTLTAQGRLPADAETPVVTSAPPDFRRQHVSDESWWSDALVHRPGRSEAAQGTDREREALWKRRPTIGQVDEYRLTYTFRCVLGAHHPTPAMREATRKLDGPPAPETDGTLRPTPRVQSDHRDVEALARELAGNADAAADQVRAFHDHVFALPNLWLWAGHTALDCLRAGGDDAGKSRLVVALCRSRGVPARVVTGLVLNPNAPPALHHWAEAWVRSPDGPEATGSRHARPTATSARAAGPRTTWSCAWTTSRSCAGRVNRVCRSSPGNCRTGHRPANRPRGRSGGRSRSLPSPRPSSSSCSSCSCSRSPPSS
jgi:hypothetical protein